MGTVRLVVFFFWFPPPPGPGRIPPTKVHVGCGSWGCLLLRLRVNIHAAPPLLPSSTADAGMIKEETDDCGVHCGGRALLTSPACRGNSVCWVYSLGEMTTIDR